MAINFSVGDVLIPNVPYVEKTLNLVAITDHLKATSNNLGRLKCEPSEVKEVGNLTFPVRSYIRVCPNDSSHVLFKSGNGIVLFLDTDTQINNSLELSTAFIKDKCFLKVSAQSYLDLQTLDSQ